MTTGRKRKASSVVVMRHIIIRVFWRLSVDLYHLVTTVHAVLMSDYISDFCCLALTLTLYVHSSATHTHTHSSESLTCVSSCVAEWG